MGVLSFRKFITIMVAVCYGSTQVVLGSLAESNVWADRQRRIEFPRVAPSLVSNLAKKPVVDKKFAHFSIPFTHGSIQDVYDSKQAGQRPIVLLQDVHLNSEAQTNIAAILQELVTSEKIQWVGIEGAFNRFDFSVAKSADKLKLRELSQSLLDRNQIGAHTFVGLNGGFESTEVIGVDDLEHYERNVQAYLDSIESKPTVKAALDKNRIQLIEEKERVFSPKLKIFDRIQSDYHEGKLGFGAYAQQLAGYDDDLDLSLQQFLEAYRMESTLDFQRVDHERKIVMEKLTRALSESEVQSLINDSLAYRMGQIGFGAYYTQLRTLCEKKNVSLRAAPAFDAYIRYVLLSDSIKAEPLFAAIKKLETKIVDDLAKTGEEKRIIRESQRLYLVGKLIEFSLTSDEWAEYKVLGTEQTTVPFPFRGRGRVGETPPLTPPLQRRGTDVWGSFESFYIEADHRSEKMLEKIPSGGVLVTGGFHSPHITRLLKEQKRSYIVVSPKLTQVDTASGSAYLSVFDREKTPLEKLFSGHKLFINPASVSAVRSVGELKPLNLPNVDRLLKKAKETEVLISSNQTNNAVRKTLGALYVTVGMNWEIVYQLMIPASVYIATVLGIANPLIGSIAWVVQAALFAWIHPNRKPGNGWILMVIGLILGLPFTDFSFLPAIITDHPVLSNLIFHTAYNTLVFFTPLKRWLPIASVFDSIRLQLIEARYQTIMKLIRKYPGEDQESLLKAAEDLRDDVSKLPAGDFLLEITQGSKFTSLNIFIDSIKKEIRGTNRAALSMIEQLYDQNLHAYSAAVNLLRNYPNQNVALVQFMTYFVFLRDYKAARILYTQIHKNLSGSKSAQQIENFIRKNSIPVHRLIESKEKSEINSRLTRGRALIAEKGLQKRWDITRSSKKALEMFGDLPAADQIALAAVFYKDRFSVDLDLITSLDRKINSFGRPIVPIKESEMAKLVTKLTAWSVAFERMPYTFMALNPSIEKVMIVGTGRAFHEPGQSRILLDLQDNLTTVYHELGHTTDPGWILYFDHIANIYERADRNKLKSFARRYGHEIDDLTGDDHDDMVLIQALISKIFRERRNAWRVVRRNSKYHDLSENRKLGFWEGFLADLKEEKKIIRENVIKIEQMAWDEHGKWVIRRYDQAISYIESGLKEGRLPSNEQWNKLSPEEINFQTTLRDDNRPNVTRTLGWDSVVSNRFLNVILDRKAPPALAHAYSFEVPKTDKHATVPDPVIERLRKDHYEWWAERVRLYMSYPDELLVKDPEAYELIELLFSTKGSEANGHSGSKSVSKQLNQIGTINSSFEKLVAAIEVALGKEGETAQQIDKALQEFERETQDLWQSHSITILDTLKLLEEKILQPKGYLIEPQYHTPSETKRSVHLYKAVGNEIVEADMGLLRVYYVDPITAIDPMRVQRELEREFEDSDNESFEKDDLDDVDLDDIDLDDDDLGDLSFGVGSSPRDEERDIIIASDGEQIIESMEADDEIEQLESLPVDARLVAEVDGKRLYTTAQTHNKMKKLDEFAADHDTVAEIFGMGLTKTLKDDPNTTVVVDFVGPESDRMFVADLFFTNQIESAFLSALKHSQEIKLVLVDGNLKVESDDPDYSYILKDLGMSEQDAWKYSIKLMAKAGPSELPTSLEDAKEWIRTRGQFAIKADWEMIITGGSVNIRSSYFQRVDAEAKNQKADANFNMHHRPQLGLAVGIMQGKPLEERNKYFRGLLFPSEPDLTTNRRLEQQWFEIRALGTPANLHDTTTVTSAYYHVPSISAAAAKIETIVKRIINLSDREASPEVLVSFAKELIEPLTALKEAGCELDSAIQFALGKELIEQNDRRHVESIKELVLHQFIKRDNPIENLRQLTIESLRVHDELKTYRLLAEAKEFKNANPALNDQILDLFDNNDLWWLGTDVDAVRVRKKADVLRNALAELKPSSEISDRLATWGFTIIFTHFLARFFPRVFGSDLYSTSMRKEAIKQNASLKVAQWFEPLVIFGLILFLLVPIFFSGGTFYPVSIDLGLITLVFSNGLFSLGHLDWNRLMDSYSVDRFNLDSLSYPKRYGRLFVVGLAFHLPFVASLVFGPTISQGATYTLMVLSFGWAVVVHRFYNRAVLLAEGPEWFVKWARGVGLPPKFETILRTVSNGNEEEFRELYRLAWKLQKLSLRKGDYYLTSNFNALTQFEEEIENRPWLMKEALLLSIEIIEKGEDPEVAIRTIRDEFLPRVGNREAMIKEVFKIAIEFVRKGQGLGTIRKDFWRDFLRLAETAEHAQKEWLIDEGLSLVRLLIESNLYGAKVLGAFGWGFSAFMAAAERDDQIIKDCFSVMRTLIANGIVPADVFNDMAKILNSFNKDWKKAKRYLDVVSHILISMETRQPQATDFDMPNEDDKVEIRNFLFSRTFDPDRLRAIFDIYFNSSDESAHKNIDGYQIKPKQKNLGAFYREMSPEMRKIHRQQKRKLDYNFFIPFMNNLVDASDTTTIADADLFFKLFTSKKLHQKREYKKQFRVRANFLTSTRYEAASSYFRQALRLIDREFNLKDSRVADLDENDQSFVIAQNLIQWMDVFIDLASLGNKKENPLQKNYSMQWKIALQEGMELYLQGKLSAEDLQGRIAQFNYFFKTEKLAILYGIFSQHVRETPTELKANTDALVRYSMNAPVNQENKSVFDSLLQFAQSNQQRPEVIRTIHKALMEEANGTFPTWRYTSPDYLKTLNQWQRAQSKESAEVVSQRLEKIKTNWERNQYYSTQMSDGRTLHAGFTDNFATLLNSGNPGNFHSCQACYKPGFNHGLAGTVANGWNKVVVLFDEDGTFVSRQIVRLRLTSKNELVLIREGTYGARDVHEAIMDQMLAKVAFDMGIRYVSNSDVKAELIEFNLWKGHSEWEYSDSYGKQFPESVGLIRIQGEEVLKPVLPLSLKFSSTEQMDPSRFSVITEKEFKAVADQIQVVDGLDKSHTISIPKMAFVVVNGRVYYLGGEVRPAPSDSETLSLQRLSISHSKYELYKGPSDQLYYKVAGAAGWPGARRLAQAFGLSAVGNVEGFVLGLPWLWAYAKSLPQAPPTTVAAWLDSGFSFAQTTLTLLILSFIALLIIHTVFGVLEFDVQSQTYKPKRNPARIFWASVTAMWSFVGAPLIFAGLALGLWLPVVAGVGLGAVAHGKANRKVELGEMTEGARQLAKILRALSADRTSEALIEIQGLVNLDLANLNSPNQLNPHFIQKWSEWAADPRFRKLLKAELGPKFKASSVENHQLLAVVLGGIGLPTEFISALKTDAPRVFVMSERETAAVVMEGVKRTGLDQRTRFVVRDEDKTYYESIAAALNKLGAKIDVVTFNSTNEAEVGLANGVFDPAAVQERFRPAGLSFDGLFFILSGNIKFDGSNKNIDLLNRLVPPADRLYLENIGKIVEAILTAA